MSIAQIRWRSRCSNGHQRRPGPLSPLATRQNDSPPPVEASLLAFSWRSSVWRAGLGRTASMQISYSLLILRLPSAPEILRFIVRSDERCACAPAVEIWFDLVRRSSPSQGFGNSGGWPPSAIRAMLIASQSSERLGRIDTHESARDLLDRHLWAPPARPDRKSWMLDHCRWPRGDLKATRGGLPRYLRS